MKSGPVSIKMFVTMLKPTTEPGMSFIKENSGAGDDAVPEEETASEDDAVSGEEAVSDLVPSVFFKFVIAGLLSH
jgi:hypothetical protein